MRLEFAAYAGVDVRRLGDYSGVGDDEDKRFTLRPVRAPVQRVTSHAPEGAGAAVETGGDATMGDDVTLPGEEGNLRRVGIAAGGSDSREGHRRRCRGPGAESGPDRQLRAPCDLKGRKIVPLGNVRQHVAGWGKVVLGGQRSQFVERPS